MKELYYDELLNIETIENQIGFNKSFHYHRYEPTPYIGLEQLFEQYELKESDRLVDFGCGKGRLNFFVHYMFQASTVGVEMNEEFFEDAMKNLHSYTPREGITKEHISFHCCFAQDYQVNPLDNRFYFFNPFSVQIFMKVIDNILRSVEERHREVELILYYTNEDYVYFLDNHYAFELKQEIILPGLYNTDNSERFLIYRLVY